MKKDRLLLALFVLSACLSAFAQTNPTWVVINNPLYDTDDVGVMTYNVKDFGALGDGLKDDRAAIVNAISKAKADGGGVVYIPEGKYYDSYGGYGTWRLEKAGQGTRYRRNYPDGAGHHARIRQKFGRLFVYYYGVLYLSD